jgi:hypothetical protein
MHLFLRRPVTARFAALRELPAHACRESLFLQAGKVSGGSSNPRRPSRFAIGGLRDVLTNADPRGGPAL